MLFSTGPEGAPGGGVGLTTSARADTGIPGDLQFDAKFLR